MERSVSQAFAFAPQATPPADTLPALLGTAQIERSTEKAWSSLKPTLERLIRRLEADTVLEVGGGRHPFFSLEEANRLGIRLVVNDIDVGELRYAPNGFERTVFDIAREIHRSDVEFGSFDLVFSRMVFEHVKDARRAWSNVYELLAPGGVGFAFVPTLYSPPFLANWLMPEFVTGRLVHMLDRSRNDAEIPKFPAYYRACRASETSMRPFLTALGFREVTVVPFFGTPYLPRVPVLKHAARYFDRVIERRDWRTFASYAYIAARK